MGPGALRNIGVVAHIDAGKTTVSERILYLTGVEHRVGRVDEGTATLDWMAEERERGITITSAATRVQWGRCDLNLIDTPGHVDFTVEVERCMRVLDGAVLVIDAVAGVQAQSETVWRQMVRHAVPCVCFVNKCDKPGADVLAASKSLSDRLGARSVPVMYPMYSEDQVVGVVDLVRGQAWTYAQDGAQAECDIPADIFDEVQVLRSELIDILAEEDEVLIEVVLEDLEPTVDQLDAALRRRVIHGSLVPVLCGAALRGIGVQPLLDAIVAWLPGPLDRPAVVGCDPDGTELQPRRSDPEESLTALAFKVHASTYGDLTFVRIYAGILRPGAKIWNPRTRTMERAGRILRMHADHGEALEEVGPGDIVALVGLKNTATGDTLCDRAAPILLEPPTFPEPVIALVVEPASSADRDKLRVALERLAREDPTFHLSEDSNTGQWTIEGMGELHLEVQLHRLQAEHGIEARVGQPRVSYKESITSSGTGTAVIDTSIGGKDVFGAVEVLAEPREDGPCVEWAEGVELPPVFREAVEQAMLLEAQTGPRFGFPLAGGRLLVTGVQRSREREAEIAFAHAGTLALRQALKQAGSAVLEPRMAFEIQSPEEFASGIIADLGSRKAEVGEVVADGELRNVLGTVALARMFGYSTAIRSLSQGRASFSMTPAGFVRVPEVELRARGLD